MSRDTKIAAGGLRYECKQAGSMFGGYSNTRSCIYCGEHRAASQRKPVKFGLRPEVACEPPCLKNPAGRRSSGQPT